MSYKVVLSSSFKRCVKKYKKRYRHVKDDVKIAIDVLLDKPKLGYVIPRSSGIRKLRVKNSDIDKGKSAGYRLIYSVENEPEPIIYLLLIYAKSDQDNVTKNELENLFDELMQKMNEKTKNNENSNYGGINKI